jgi:hypothetical protein
MTMQAFLLLSLLCLSPPTTVETLEVYTDIVDNRRAEGIDSSLTDGPDGYQVIFNPGRTDEFYVYVRTGATYSFVSGPHVTATELDTMITRTADEYRVLAQTMCTYCEGPCWMKDLGGGVLSILPAPQGQGGNKYTALQDFQAQVAELKAAGYVPSDCWTQG